MRKLVLLVAVVVATAVTLLSLGDGPGLASDGDTISSPDTVDDVGLLTSLALDAAGNPVISYRDATNGDLKVLHCGDPGCTSNNSITSPDSGIGSPSSSKNTSLALDSTGNPVVSYASDTLRVLHCGNPNCTAGNSIAAPDSVLAGYTSLALDGSGNPVVAYKDFTNGTLSVLHCGNPNCTAGNSIVSPDPSPFTVGLSASLALDGAGNPVVSYGSTNRLAVLHCGNPNCTAGNTIALPNEEGSGSAHSSLVLDGSGNPVVSYRTGSDLMVLHCGNPMCTAGNTIASPDAGGIQGGPTLSLVLDGLGNPVVSYRSHSSRDLKVLHCGDPNCTTGNSITNPDWFGQVGGHASLALDTNGNPVVSYYDQTNGDLKVLHCGDATCKSGPPDTDGDGLFDDDEVNIYFTDPLDPDTDDDLCSDGTEVGPLAGAGGQRDPLSYWDWYDQWINGAKDGSVTVGDIGAVVARFGTSRGSVPTKQEAFDEAIVPPADATGYHASVDRGPGLAGPNPWNLTPPDGSIVVGEIGAVVAQFGHAGCAANNP